MKTTYFPERVRHIGLFGLPVYEVLVVDQYTDESRQGFFGHIEIVWGYARAMWRAWSR